MCMLACVRACVYVCVQDNMCTYVYVCTLAHMAGEIEIELTGPTKGVRIVKSLKPFMYLGL